MKAVVWGAAVYAFCAVNGMSIADSALLGVTTIGLYVVLMGGPLPPSRPRGQE